MPNLDEIKFNRNYRAEFEIGTRDFEQDKLEPEEILTIKYPTTLILDIDSGCNDTSSNTGAFQFYNLSRQDQAKLWIDEYNQGKKYIKMNLYAGYGDVMPLVFSGFVFRCTSSRNGGATNWITEMMAYDGGMLFRYGYINDTIYKGTALKDILAYMTEKYDVKPGYITDNIPPLPQNRTFIGQTMDLLGREYGGYDIFVQNGELNVLAQNEVIPGDIQVISSATGLLGSPTRGNLYTEIESIFEPRLKVRQAVSLISDSLPEFNNVYEVVQIKHKGVISPVVCDTLKTSATLSLFATDEQKVMEKTAPSTYGGTPTTGQWIKPLAKGRVSSSYGRRTPFKTQTGKMSSTVHLALDIAAPLKTPVVAPANGNVTLAGWLDGYGKAIIINHGKIDGKTVTSFYGHLSEILVGKKQVYQGEKIGLVGSTGNSTGPHLHFEVTENGVKINPTKYIGNY